MPLVASNPEIREKDAAEINFWPIRTCLFLGYALAHGPNHHATENQQVLLTRILTILAVLEFGVLMPIPLIHVSRVSVEEEVDSASRR